MVVARIIEVCMDHILHYPYPQTAAPWRTIQLRSTQQPPSSIAASTT